MARQAVEAVVPAHRDAEPARLADAHQADGAAVGFSSRIPEPIAFVVVLLALRLFLGAQRRRLREAGDAHVVGTATVHVALDAPATAERGTESRGQRALVERRVAAQFDRAGERSRQLRRRQPTGHHVDGAGGGGIAEQQRGRSLQDLDALRKQRLDRHGVIVRQRRDVQRIAAVDVHLHAQPSLSADQRAAGDRAEPARREARYVAQCLAKAGCALQDERIAIDDPGGLCGLQWRLTQRRRVHHHLLEVPGNGRGGA